MLVAHPEVNPDPKEDIVAKFTKEWGTSEEWEEEALKKHVYLGRVLTEKHQVIV